MSTMLKIIGLGRRIEPGLLVLGWGVTTAALALAQIFQGNLIPQQYYGGVSNQVLSAGTIFDLETFGLSIFAGIVITDAGRAVISFIISYLIAGATTFLVILLPALVGTYPLPDLLFASAISFTFTALFPIPLLTGFVGTFLGAGLSERLL